jgi:hypothetical protein
VNHTSSDVQVASDKSFAASKYNQSMLEKETEKWWTIGKWTKDITILKYTLLRSICEADMLVANL